jgi:hypothetical protein
MVIISGSAISICVAILWVAILLSTAFQGLHLSDGQSWLPITATELEESMHAASIVRDTKRKRFFHGPLLDATLAGFS